MYTELIFSDLTKTFDSVYLEILLAKLHFYEIQGVSQDWFTFHLTKRSQKVEIKLTNTRKNKTFSLTGAHCNMVFPKDQL